VLCAAARYMHRAAWSPGTCRSFISTFNPITPGTLLPLSFGLCLSPPCLASVSFLLSQVINARLCPCDFCFSSE
jgi:hypothetical protein